MLGARHLCLGSKTLVSCSHDSTCMECSHSRWPGSVGIVRILLGCGGISIGVDCPKQPRLLQGVRKVGRAVEDTVFLKWLRRRKEPPKVHVQAAFYKVGAEAVKAAHSGASSEEVRRVGKYPIYKQTQNQHVQLAGLADEGYTGFDVLCATISLPRCGNNGTIHIGAGLASHMAIAAIGGAGGGRRRWY